MRDGDPPRGAVGLVMAGGRGSRMGASRPDVPKPLVPVGGTALLERVLRALAAAGVDAIHVATGHAAVEVEAFAAALSEHLPVDVRFVREDAPLGTIGALGLLPHPAGTTLVVNGDLLSGVDLDAVLGAHAASRADLTIVTHVEEHRLRLGEVDVAFDGRVRAYREKPLKRFTISSGIYALEPAVAALVRPGEPLGANELVERALGAGLHVRAHADEAPWLDVNDAEDLEHAERLLARSPASFARSDGEGPR